MTKMGKSPSKCSDTLKILGGKHRWARSLEQPVRVADTRGARLPLCGCLSSRKRPYYFARGLSLTASSCYVYKWPQVPQPERSSGTEPQQRWGSQGCAGAGSYPHKRRFRNSASWLKLLAWQRVTIHDEGVYTADISKCCKARLLLLSPETHLFSLHQHTEVWYVNSPIQSDAYARVGLWRNSNQDDPRIYGTLTHNRWYYTSVGHFGKRDY